MPRNFRPLWIAFFALLPLALAMCAANNPAWRSLDLEPPAPAPVQPAEAYDYDDEFD